MLYILDQRLQAQKISSEKCAKVINDIIRTMIASSFVEELFKHQVRRLLRSRVKMRRPQQCDRSPCTLCAMFLCVILFAIFLIFYDIFMASPTSFCRSRR